MELSMEEAPWPVFPMQLPNNNIFVFRMLFTCVTVPAHV